MVLAVKFGRVWPRLAQRDNNETEALFCAVVQGALVAAPLRLNPIGAVLIAFGVRFEAPTNTSIAESSHRPLVVLLTVLLLRALSFGRMINRLACNRPPFSGGPTMITTALAGNNKQPLFQGDHSNLGAFFINKFDLYLAESGRV